MRILCPSKASNHHHGLLWGLRRIGHEVVICEMAGRSAGNRVQTWRRAWLDCRPDLVLFLGFWKYTYQVDDLAPPPGERRVPMVYWATDDPVYTALLSLPILPKVDLILTTAEECLRLYGRHGRRAALLQFGCNPELQKRIEPRERHQIVLVGNNYYLGSPFRLRCVKEILLPLIEDGYDVKVWGNWWTDDVPGHIPEQCWEGTIKFEEVARIYAGADIVLGMQFANTSPTQTSRRVFEVLGSRAFHLAPDTRATRKYFLPGKHLVVTDSADETLTLAKYYLDHPAERERIAAAGQLEVYAKHTYVHRAREFERIVGEFL